MIRILLVLGVMLWAGAGNAEKAKKCMTAKDIAGGYFLVYSADKDGVVSDSGGIKWAIPYRALPQIVEKLNKLSDLVQSIDKRVGKIESRLSQIENRLKKIEQPNDYPTIDCGRTGK